MRYRSGKTNSRSLRTLAAQLRYECLRSAMLIGILVSALLGTLDINKADSTPFPQSNRTISEAAQNQNVPGTGNPKAIELSRGSPVVQSAYRFLIKQARTIKDSKLREETLDAITDSGTCIRHRAGL